MKKFACRALMVLSLVASATLASADEERLYAEGPVTELSFIKVKPGKFDAYMKWLSTDRKRLLDAEKKAGILVDYKVYVTEAHNPTEPDIILAETFPNMAAYDGLRVRVEAIEVEVFGSKKTVSHEVIERGEMRELLGRQMIREMVLK